MKKIYPEGQNPFAGKKVANFKGVVTYPREGSIRYQVQLDKNGQVHDIKRSYAKTVVDPETKKKYLKISTRGRDKELFNRIHGRPFELACPWIDEYLLNKEE